MNRIITIILSLHLLISFAMSDSHTKRMESMKNNKELQKQIIENLVKKNEKKCEYRIKKGVEQVATFWTQNDGNDKDFEKFCKKNFIASQEKLYQFFKKFSKYREVLLGHFNQINLGLQETLHLDKGKIGTIDYLFGSYSAGAHLKSDMFKNKIAFHVLLNFPHYTLKEKLTLGKKWTRKQWAYARLGDVFTSNVPPKLIQEMNTIFTKSDQYIAEYNIYMGQLVDKNNKNIFPKGLKLISHWGLRDEIKGQYSSKNGLNKQKIIYTIMKRIIKQNIPQKIINSNKYQWNPIANKVYKNNKEVAFKPEANTRYKQLLNNFYAVCKVDKYYPYASTYIKRNFDVGMEIPVDEIEKVFQDFLSASVTEKVAKRIQKRLGRKLLAFDIWYDGFKTRSKIPEKKLDEIVGKKYKNMESFQKGLKQILLKLGFKNEKAKYITDRIVVDPARGAGHAWGPEMRTGKAHLRTRFTKNGMNYKGYNIAIHEMGHNVEQVLSLYDIDYYMLRGVPNNAFTEALAFIFQAKDLELLGMEETSQEQKELSILDHFWSTREIMGVALVDIRVWKWIYKNPNATTEEFKKAVIDIAKDVWNKYYAKSFGIKDEPILAIYSHMIAYPLYLSYYPLGYLIQFQIEEKLNHKNFASQIQRIFSYGNVIPEVWMQHAVGSTLSGEPMLKAVRKVFKK